MPVIQWELKVIHATLATPRYRCLLQKREEIELLLLFFLAVELPSGRQLPASGHSAVTKGFQLCRAGPQEGPCTQRSHCYNPRASSHSSMLHTCGEFQANKFKSRVVYFLGNTQGVLDVPLALCASRHTPGTRCQLHNW